MRSRSCEFTARFFGAATKFVSFQLKLLNSQSKKSEGGDEIFSVTYTVHNNFKKCKKSQNKTLTSFDFTNSAYFSASLFIAQLIFRSVGNFPVMTRLGKEKSAAYLQL